MIPELFHLPDGASNVHWSAMEEGETDDSALSGSLVQLTFDLDGFDIQAVAEATYDG